MDQLPLLGQRELICLLLFPCNYVVSIWKGSLFLWVLGMGHVILLWHSLSLPYNYFEQLVKIPTREDNILNLFLTNQPGKVHATKTLPSLGSSDHDIVFHEISIPIGRPMQSKRKIKLHGKTNWEQFKSDINSFNESFQSKNESDPNKLWIIFKTEIDRLSDLSIPSKITRSRCDLPWISSSIRKKIHKRDKLHQKVKKSKGKQNYDKMKSKLSNIQIQYSKRNQEVLLGIP